ncbi:HAD family hydrolase [Pseudomonas sp. BGr12]|uniref:HAD family phosphatase n=2 Tax=Pseudomonas nitroreducens/multiresinivorans group TaxID=627141 RepID=A0A6G6J3Y7_PSENT|nr:MULTISPECIES: HAD family phosphatase [Pseudomonas]KJJ97121.1 HAD family hydrolase [Pseudomonas sp. 21]MBD9501245.1 HAD family phosphatase [Pseudomonas sp. PDM17]MBD9576218.1 HAD family phosphatase [Pseudomonas sp. PDM23]MBD9670145.1 HAD family phosphatase [Pseudomonas sp. PDM21]MBG6289419.1 HAD family phosphatase [Pseudomonas nitroreducens]
MIKAVIFDMDGVLIEAKDWHYEALNKALNLFGHTISRHDHLTTYDGLPTSRKLNMLSVEHDLPVELHNFINEMKQAYTMEIVYSQCKPTFNHQYALSSLKNRGYKLAVASNSIRNTVEVMMDKARLDQYLDLKLSNEDVKSPKPAPDIYTKAIQSFGLSPDECLIVEDNENGIRAARASGAHVLVVEDVADVNLDNITRRIEQIEAQRQERLEA